MWNMVNVSDNTVLCLKIWTSSLNIKIMMPELMFFSGVLFEFFIPAFIWQIIFGN